MGEWENGRMGERETFDLARGVGCQGGEIQADRLWIRGQGVQIVAAAPSGGIPPVGCVGAPSGRRLAAGKVLGSLDHL
jgi:hypothetical protein